MDEYILETAINTYCVVILGMSPYEVASTEFIASFYLDPFEYTDEDIIDVCHSMLEVFENYEHYEKCSDIIEYLENYGV